jgi:hypothetical protein
VLVPAEPCHSSTWGGSRNRADRASLHLSRRQVEAMLAATLHAQNIGLAFNRHWTVHYEAAGIAERDGAGFIRRLLRLASKQVRRDGGEIAALWARENGDGKGGHVHILMHLPIGMTLRNRTRRWIVAAGGTYARRASRASRVRSIAGMRENEGIGDCDGDCATLSNLTISEHYRANADAVLAYLLKGASEHTGKALALPRYGEGGPIIGKRAGWTQNIGRAARDSAAKVAISSGGSLAGMAHSARAKGRPDTFSKRRKAVAAKRNYAKTTLRPNGGNSAFPS